MPFGMGKSVEPAQSGIVAKLEKLPWWAAFPASLGSSLMGVFAPDVLPDWAPLVFFALGAALFMFGTIAAGWHFLRDEDAVGPSMSFRDVVRRVALRTEWGLSYAVREQSWPTWQEDLKREVLHKLAGKPPQAYGIRNARGEPEDSAPTLIPDWFWAKADFYPEHMLADNETGMIWQKGKPCPLLYMDVEIRRADVDELWPAVPKRRRVGRVSAFAALAREWHDTHEDARLNRNPGVGFDAAWNERAKLDDLSQASAFPPPADENLALKEKCRKAGQAFQDKHRDIIASGRDLAHRFREEKPLEHWENWVRKQRVYMDIQPHLGDEYQAWVIRNALTVHLTNDGSSYPEAMFLRELARLEKEWGLV